MKFIQQVTVGAGGISTIDFSSIPTTFTDLYLVVSLRSSSGSAVDFLRMDFNGDTNGANYTARSIYGSGSGSVVSFVTNPGNFVADCNGNGSTANTFSSFACYIPNYRSSTAKTRSIDHVSEANVTAAYQVVTASIWNSTAPISSIQLLFPGNSFVAGSSATLYGITAGSTPGVTVA